MKQNVRESQGLETEMGELQGKLDRFHQAFEAACFHDPDVYKDKAKIIKLLRSGPTRAEATKEMFRHHFSYPNSPELCEAFLACTDYIVDLMGRGGKYQGDPRVAGEIRDNVGNAADRLRHVDPLQVFQKELDRIHEQKKTAHSSLLGMLSDESLMPGPMQTCKQKVYTCYQEAEGLFTRLREMCPTPEKEQEVLRQLDFKFYICRPMDVTSMTELEEVMRLDTLAMQYEAAAAEASVFTKSINMRRPLEGALPRAKDCIERAADTYGKMCEVLGDQQMLPLLQGKQQRLQYAYEQLFPQDRSVTFNLSPVPGKLVQLNRMSIDLEDLHSKFVHTGLSFDGRECREVAEKYWASVKREVGFEDSRVLRNGDMSPALDRVRGCADVAKLQTYLQAWTTRAEAYHYEMRADPVTGHGRLREKQYQNATEVTLKAVEVACATRDEAYQQLDPRYCASSHVEGVFPTLAGQLLDYYAHYHARQGVSRSADESVKNVGIKHQVLGAMLELFTKQADVLPQADICQQLDENHRGLLKDLINHSGMQPPIENTADVSMELFLEALASYQRAYANAANLPALPQQEAEPSSPQEYEQVYQAALEWAKEEDKKFDSYKKKVGNFKKTVQQHARPSVEEVDVEVDTLDSPEQLERFYAHVEQVYASDGGYKKAKPLYEQMVTYGEEHGDREVARRGAEGMARYDETASLTTLLERSPGKEEEVLDVFYARATALLNTPNGHQDGYRAASEFYQQMIDYGRRSGNPEIEGKGLFGRSCCHQLSVLPRVKDAIVGKGSLGQLMDSLSQAFDDANSALEALSATPGQLYVEVVQMQAEHVEQTMKHIEKMVAAKKDAGAKGQREAMHRMKDGWYHNVRAQQYGPSPEAKEFAAVQKAEKELLKAKREHNWRGKEQNQAALRDELPAHKRRDDWYALCDQTLERRPVRVALEEGRQRTVREAIQQDSAGLVHATLEALNATSSSWAGGETLRRSVSASEVGLS